MPWYYAVMPAKIDLILWRIQASLQTLNLSYFHKYLSIFLFCCLVNSLNSSISWYSVIFHIRNHLLSDYQEASHCLLKPNILTNNWLTFIQMLFNIMVAGARRISAAFYSIWPGFYGLQFVILFMFWLCLKEILAWRDSIVVSLAYHNERDCV